LNLDESVRHGPLRIACHGLRAIVAGPVGRQRKMGGVVKQVQFNAFGAPRETELQKVARGAAPIC
jgi:hypothetical protein